ncbi:hypothetical protein RCC30_15470 [Pseudomonas fluorescens]|nr:hypothetical protein RCC30_15470 [Pseudomonas fluorescens]
MTSRFMFVSGVVVVLVVMGLASATRPFLKLDLWLDQRESPVTAQANALSPIIACVNRVDVHWRNAYDKTNISGQPLMRSESIFPSLRISITVMHSLCVTSRKIPACGISTKSSSCWPTSQRCRRKSVTTRKH